ncbi:proline-rich receptor-like protein kinase PERK2 [Perca fluviatilis]|uniref:proline-rich receptor-like protein kinase PERK2 n=1 Tax=Perca fluviatilis TaxID=8168 RepID=UPI001963BD03|nr:proline-rich receptor-like protein kinase PERK2 [Perca fluviatilis]
MTVAKETKHRKEKKKSPRRNLHTMSSDHIWLLRRPLPPKRIPPVGKPRPAPRPSGVKMTSLPLDQGLAGVGGSSRQDPDTPAPRAAPPTPLHPSPPLTDTITEGFPWKRFPWKRLRLRPNNPLLTLLQTDKRFIAPPPTFCLSDFLQSGDDPPPPPPTGAHRLTSTAVTTPDNFF